MTKPKASVSEIIAYLEDHGHTVTTRDGMLVITPQLKPEDQARLNAREAEMVAFLTYGLALPPEPIAELPLASEHAFTVASSTPIEKRVDTPCVACGIPWRYHGEPLRETFRVVADPNAVETIKAREVPLSTRGAA